MSSETSTSPSDIMDINSSPSVSSIRLEVHTNSLHNLAGKFPEEKERKGGESSTIPTESFPSETEKDKGKDNRR